MGLPWGAGDYLMISHDDPVRTPTQLLVNKHYAQGGGPHQGKGIETTVSNAAVSRSSQLI